MSELVLRLALGCSVVAIPVTLERMLPATRFAQQRLLEAMALATALAVVAHGLMGETAGRAVALGSILFSAQRVIRSPSAGAAGAAAHRSAPGDPLMTAAALGVAALIQPSGPTSPFHGGLGMLTTALFLYLSADSRFLAGFMALSTLLQTAVALFA